MITVKILYVPSWSCSQAVSKPVWHIPLLCLQWKTPDYGQRNCPKHVEFYSKNKFEKLVHLVGFIIRIYHDARSPEGCMRSTYALYIITLGLIIIPPVKKSVITQIRLCHRNNGFSNVGLPCSCNASIFVIIPNTHDKEISRLVWGLYLGLLVKPIVFIKTGLWTLF